LTKLLESELSINLLIALLHSLWQGIVIQDCCFFIYSSKIAKKRKREIHSISDSRWRQWCFVYFLHGPFLIMSLSLQVTLFQQTSGRNKQISQAVQIDNNLSRNGTSGACRPATNQYGWF